MEPHAHDSEHRYQIVAGGKHPLCGRGCRTGIACDRCKIESSFTVAREAVGLQYWFTGLSNLGPPLIGGKLVLAAASFTRRAAPAGSAMCAHRSGDGPPH